jgi:phenylalanyl-tRNA synthetase beta chain
MKIPASWLFDFLETTASPADLATGLTSLGLEVESLEDPASALAPFCTAHILSAQRHPNAEKLQICRVDTQHHKDLQIVCGAPNARAGLKVVLGLPGTFVPGLQITLKASSIRGVESHGMLCSAAELCLGTDGQGIIELPPETPLSLSVAEALDLNDTLFDIAITPNRGDCFGIYGVARDLAAAGLGKLKPVTVNPPSFHIQKPLPRVNNLAPEACPLFALALIEGVTNTDTSPFWQKRMRAAGLKVISGIVDVTNIISHAYNRPLHAFDADTIVGDITLRLSEAGEVFDGLDDQSYTLPAGALVITDEQGIISLAGILGGRRTACTTQTRRILLESAWFQPSVIARAGQALSLTSDARMRFERGVDPESTLTGLYRAIADIQSLTGGTVVGLQTLSEPRFLPQLSAIPFDPALVSRLTGMPCEEGRIRKILTDLGCAWDGNGVMPPSWRFDLSRPEDLVEEVMRVVGMTSLPSLALPPMTPTPVRPPQAQAAAYLCHQGYHETLSFSFTSRAWLKTLGDDTDVVGLLNPISEALDVLRPSLIPTMLKTADYNARHNTGLTHLFEMGPIYPGRRQENSLAFLCWASPQKTWRGPQVGADPFDLKGMAANILALWGYDTESLTGFSSGLPAVYHPGQSLGWGLGPKQPVAYFGALHPSVFAHLEGIRHLAMAEIFIDRLPAKRPKKDRYQPQPYPPVYRDLAFFIPQDIAYGVLKKSLMKAGKPLVKHLEVFDVYQGPHVPEGQKSIALRLTLQDSDKTLSEKTIEDVLSAITQALSKDVKAVLRDGK